MNALKVDRFEDENLITIVENDACGVDTIQVAADCSIKKGQSDPQTIQGSIPIPLSTANPTGRSGLASDLNR
jgi:hypothetical protein